MTEVTPAPAVATAQAYKVPTHPAPADLLLHGNEGVPADPRIWEALDTTSTELLRRYPNVRPLQVHLADQLGVDPTRLVVTAGGDDALDRAFRAFLWPGREVVLPVPTFVMMTQYARMAGATTRPVMWPGGAFPLDAVLAEVTPQTGAVVVVSPNNPTGATITASQLRALSEAAPHVLLIVDLAYIEFADDDLTPVALTLPNAIIFRTLSKAWGLAGLRVGYAAGPAKLIGHLQVAGSPYMVSALSAALALRQVETASEAMARYVAAAKRERALLHQTLTELGARSEPSQGNFAFARFATRELALWVADAMASCGIRIRAFPTRSAIDDAIRITCPGDDRAMTRVVAGLRAALSPEQWSKVTDVAGVQAARSAGQIPIGLSLPGADSPGTLLKAGAARIVRDIKDVEELLT
ncbi:MAG: histidinol-phosphate aminotransferase [Myxococcota bacterium]|jgi:histidinol-phosphate aminotransferase